MNGSWVDEWQCNLPITNYQLPTINYKAQIPVTDYTNYQITNYHIPNTKYQIPNTNYRLPSLTPLRQVNASLHADKALGAQHKAFILIRRLPLFEQVSV